MKKRAMKKWIPKDTIYCYNYDKHRKYNIYDFTIPVKVCPWYKVTKKYDKKYNEYYNETFCRYCNEGDEYDVGCLYDECKICGEHEPKERY